MGHSIWQFLQTHSVLSVFVSIVMVGSMLTMLQLRQVVEANQMNVESRFALQFNELTAKTMATVSTYQQVLRAVQGLFIASESVSREEFHAFYQRLKLEQFYPGMQGIGYAPLIRPEQVEAHQSAVRAEGFADYQIMPADQRSVYSSILYLEPFSGRNLRAFGYDMYSESTRREAMQRARDTGQVSISNSVLLVQDEVRGSVRGLLMYMPIYDQILVEGAQKNLRRQHHLGWVHGVFRIADIVKPLLTSAHAVNQLQIIEKTPDGQQVLFQSEQQITPQFVMQNKQAIGGKHWTFIGSPDEAFILQNQLHSQRTVVLVGVILTLLIAVLIASLMSSRNRAIRLANRMTRSLSAKNARLILASEALEMGIWQWQFSSNQIHLDTKAKQLYGLDETENNTLSFQQWLMLISEKDQLKVQQFFEQVQHNTQPGELTVHLKNRQVIQLNATLELDESGQPHSLLGVSTDTTEYWQHQTVLEETEQRWKHALEGSGAGVWDWRIVDNSLVLSEQVMMMLGFDHQELTFQVAHWMERIHPDDLPQVKQDIDNLLAGAQISHRSEHRLLCEDGSWKWVLQRGAVIERDEHNQPVRAIGTISDIDWRKQAEIALRQSEERFHNAFDTAPIGMALVSLEGRWLEVNDALCQMLGYSEAELLKTGFADITHPEDLDIDEQYVGRLIQGELDHYQLEKRYYCKDGELIDVLLSVSVVHDENGQVEHFVSQIENITLRKTEQQKIHELAFYDALTGLPNRRLFNERLSHALLSGQRSQKSIATMFIDFDYFKQINDTHGHDVGDDVIVTATQRIRNVLRKTDTLARIGGDEFVVLLEEVSSEKAAMSIAENIRRQLEMPIKSDTVSLTMTLSIGVSVTDPLLYETADSLLKKADMALYEVKAKGRNGTGLYQPLSS